jgi:hypothetical protein
MAAELWDKTGTSRIVDLSAWWGRSDAFSPVILAGKGDELWFFRGGEVPILHYLDGKVEPLPRLPRPPRVAFVSPGGELSASDGRTLHRHDGHGWIPVGELAWPARVEAMAMAPETFWAATAGAVYRLRPTASPAFKEGCATPFVHLYDVREDNGKGYTYPFTRKALSTFEGVKELALVEFPESGARRLGVTVTSGAQGEALIAHVLATMKGEEPRLLCYSPKAPRMIKW